MRHDLHSPSASEQAAEEMKAKLAMVMEEDDDWGRGGVVVVVVGPDFPLHSHLGKEEKAKFV